MSKASKVRMVEITIRSVLFKRPGVGCRSCHTLCIHDANDDAGEGTSKGVADDVDALSIAYLTTVTAVSPSRKSAGSGSCTRTRTGNLVERCTQFNVRSMLGKPPVTAPSSGKTP
jgi:hypothetical protein